MINNNHISPYQLIVIVITAVIGIGIFSLPSEIAKATGASGYIVLMLAGLVNALAVIIMVKLCKMFPDKTFPDFAQLILGKTLGKILTAIFAIILLYNIVLVLKSFTNVLSSFILLNTPASVMSIIFLLTVAYLVSSGVEGIGRFLEMAVILLFIPFILMFILGLKNIDLTALSPSIAFFNQDIKFILPVIFFSFGGFEVILYYMGYVDRFYDHKIPVLISVVFTATFAVLVFVLCIARFGVNLTASLEYPLINYIRSGSQSIKSVESLDAVLISIWTLAVFTTIISNYYIVTHSIAKIFNTNNHKKYIMPVGVIIYILGTQIDNVEQLIRRAKTIRIMQVILLIYAFPIILFTIAKMRRLGGASSEKKDENTDTV